MTALFLANKKNIIESRLIDSYDISLITFVITLEKKVCKKLYFSRVVAGDERIELPPKVLETPIIPFDQSPISVVL